MSQTATQKQTLSKQELQSLLTSLPNLPESQLQDLYRSLSEFEHVANKEGAERNFLEFVNRVWPSFISGRHHKRMARAFERVASGECKRLIINMPPRHTKSEFASYLLPAWFLGRFPNKKIIQTSHTAELAVGFGRKVRNLVDSESYKDVFPGTSLQADSKAAGRWNTNMGGEYFAIGVGGAVTGKGADLLIIDDPHSEQEATLAETNSEIYDKTYEWYTSGPRQRLQPGGSIVIVMCMTGDTPVLMVGGLEKPLKDVRPGDLVATFEDGKLSVSKVNNWQSSGVDSVYKIQTQSGKILRANERHPFLVLNEGVLEWTRLRHLQVGDLLVSLKGAIDPLGPKQNPESAPPAKQKTATTAKTQTHRTNRSGIMGNGWGLHAALRVVVAKLQAVVCVLHTTVKNIHPKNHPNRLENTELSIGTASLLNSTMQWFKSAITYAIYAGGPHQLKTHAPIGAESSVLTTATIQARSEGSYVTTAISPLVTEKQQMYLNELQRISDFTADPIVSITYDGQEEVFDVEIDRTENFIANGFVSHNTRWSKKDLTGQIIKNSVQRSGEEWEVIEFPALLPSGNPLWPEFWPVEELEVLKKELPTSKWMAQYQQNPTSEVSAIVKREWWKVWEKDDPPNCDYIIQSWDTAFLKSERADYSACTTWGIFYPEETGDDRNAHIILLNAFKDRLEFPELKQRAYENWEEWEPDSLIVEAKAAGSPLIYELRAMGIPVQEFSPSRGNDKIARLNAVSDLFASGRVWVPNRHWAEELVEEVASFPSGEHDDLVDSMTQALLRFRKGGFIRLDSDQKDDIRYFKRRKGGYY
jgi:predicted phage terminase large subunit-like protein